MPTSTYTPIATTTLGSATGTVTFNSIPSTYTDLFFIANGSAASNNIDADVVINGDSGSNYSRTILWGSGSSAGSVRYSNNTYFGLTYYGNLSTTFSWIARLNFMNYANTSVYKTILAEMTNADTYGVNTEVGLWRSTSAINQIAITARSSTFSTGSTFTLYGIKAA